MSAVHEVEVCIGPDGQVQIHVRGIDGESCLDVTRELERHLGGRVLHRQHTDEFFGVRVPDSRHDRVRS